MIRGSSATRTSGGVVMVTAPSDVQCAPARANCDAGARSAGCRAQARGTRGPRWPAASQSKPPAAAHRTATGLPCTPFPGVRRQRPRSPDALRRVQAPAARHRRGRDPGLGRLVRPGPGPGGREPRPVPDVQAAQARAPAARRPAEPDQTRYINTISPEQEPFFPGDEELERRIRRLVRWNAVAMVLRANNRYAGIGGHLATYAVGGVPVRGGLQPLLPRQGPSGRRRPGVLPGPRGARASTPAPSSRAACPEEQLDHFRREAGGKGLSSYPHPRLMPDFWEFPTVSMGLGPLAAVYQARFNRYLQNRGIRDTSQQRVWAFLGDGEMDEPESIVRDLARRPRRPRQPDVRHQLQPAAPRRPRPRQRQGDPGARGPVPRRRLERDQGRLGPRVGRAARARRRRRAGREDERDARRRVPEVLGVERRLRPRALLRPRPAAAPDRRAPAPTTTSSSCAAAATTTARSTPRTRRRPSTSAPRR